VQLHRLKLHFLLDTIGDLVTLTFVKLCLTSTPADVAFKTTNTRLYLFWDITPFSVTNSTHHKHPIPDLSSKQF
jgi:hypothetical protein